MNTPQTTRRRIISFSWLALVGMACLASATEFPGSFICMSNCSDRGFLNQLMMSDGEFSIIASATPPPSIIFAEGSYLIEADKLTLSGSDFRVSFQIEHGQVDNYLGTFDAIWLKWISGTSDYFSEGMQFVETVPAMYGKPSDCMKDDNWGTPECFGQPEEVETHQPDKNDEDSP